MRSAPGLDYLETRQLLSVQPVSVANSAYYGNSGAGASGDVSLSDDGKILVFTSSAANLVTNDFNGPGNDVFSRNLTTGVVSLVSVDASALSTGNGNSSNPIVSGGGRFVLFQSQATDLVNGLTYKSSTNLFRRDLQTGTTALVTVDTSGNAVGFDFGTSSISDDGRYVAFAAPDNLNLAAGQAAPAQGHVFNDIYVRDMQTGVTSLVSVNQSATGGGNANSLNPVITGSGNFVAYYSNASNLTTDANQSTDVFERDLVHNKTIVVSENSSNTSTGDQTSAVFPGNAGRLAVSSDGRFVAFVSLADDLVKIFHDGNGSNNSDIFVRDTVAGVTSVVTMNAAGTATGDWSSGDYVGSLSMSDDGRYVAFQSGSNDLITGGTGGYVGSTQNVYLRDMTTGKTSIVSADRGGNGGANIGSSSDNPRISSDGRFVFFDSNAVNLVANDTNGAIDVFLYDRTTGKTTLASGNQAGTASGNAASPPSYTGFQGRQIAISGDGSAVAFSSAASNLVASDNNATIDIFYHGTSSGASTLASARSTAEPQAYTAHGSSSSPSISADGRYVAFESSATDLTTNDNNYPDSDVFVRDRQTGTTTLVSVNSSGTGTADNSSNTALISADGRYVIFLSRADNLIAGMPPSTTGTSQLFRRDLQTGTTILVSRDSTGAALANGQIYAPAISSDGRYVVFTSVATNLVSGVTVGYSNELYGDLYVRDIQTGTTTLVSVDTTGTKGANSDITYPAISDDGQTVVFVSAASNLVAGDSSSVSNVFVRNLTTHTTYQISSKPGDAAGASYDKPVMSSSGRYIAFTSNATDLVSIPDGNGTATSGSDVFVFDLQTKTTTLVSINAAGTASGDVDSIAPSISDDGRYVAFSSFASNLIPGGTTVQNVYVRDLQSHTTTLVSVKASGSGDAGGSNPVISGDGHVVAFQSGSTALVPGFVDNNTGFDDLYVRNLATSVTILATASDSGTGGQNEYLSDTGVDERERRRHRIQHRRIQPLRG